MVWDSICCFHGPNFAEAAKFLSVAWEEDAWDALQVAIMSMHLFWWRMIGTARDSAKLLSKMGCEWFVLLLA